MCVHITLIPSQTFITARFLPYLAASQVIARLPLGTLLCRMFSIASFNHSHSLVLFTFQFHHFNLNCSSADSAFNVPRYPGFASISFLLSSIFPEMKLTLLTRKSGLHHIVAACSTNQGQRSITSCALAPQMILSWYTVIYLSIPSLSGMGYQSSPIHQDIKSASQWSGSGLQVILTYGFIPATDLFLESMYRNCENVKCVHSSNHTKAYSAP